jgi:predicted nicotinamide N-methyase
MPGYLTQEAACPVPGDTDLLIRALSDRQQFADPQRLAESLGIGSATWPLFGVLWPSSVELAARLVQRPVSVGERILEVGCGLGLASLVGHRRGSDVTASDHHPLAGGFLAANALLNGLGPLKYRHGHWGATAAQRESAVQAGLQPLRGRFDHIIGSDLLYERDDRGQLAAFIGRHAAPGALVWIVDPDRGNRSAFNRHMAGLGFALTEMRLDRAASAGWAAYRGRLLSYQRDSGDTA